LGRNGNNAIPVKIESLADTKIISAGCGFLYTILLSEKGEVFSFGYNLCGQLGRDGDDKIPTKIPNISLF
jgi:alpha-tubulin suppressor-like RCC1 family protein